MSEATSELLTVQEVAERLKVHENTVYRWIQRDGLPAVRAGKVWRVQRDRLDAWMATQAGDDQ